MKTTHQKFFKSLYCGCVLSALCLTACNSKHNDPPVSLKDCLYSLTDTIAGTVGIALITDSDTLTVNNGVHYPMMSVFKLHQSLATIDALQNKGTNIDSIIHIDRTELDPDTWSPMLKEYGLKDIDISIRDILKYALTVSDNNASNILFTHIVSPKETDAFIRSIAGDTTFQIMFSEAEMKENHARAYLNHTSPLAAAALMKQVFDTSFIETSSLDSIRKDLTQVTTGHDRLGSVIHTDPEIFFAHKTGSGYRNDANELAAHNDVGYFRLPNGKSYSLAVFIRDFSGSEAEASRVISDISQTVFDFLQSD